MFDIIFTIIYNNKINNYDYPISIPTYNVVTILYYGIRTSVHTNVEVSVHLSPVSTCVCMCWCGIDVAIMIDSIG